MNRRYGLAVLLLCAATPGGNTAQAAGLWLYEQATPDMGTASAGRAATADNAATAAGNPAGMTRLRQSEFLVGVQPLYIKSEFDTEAARFGGDDGGNAGGWVPAAGINYVHSLSADLKLGISAGSYFGLGLDYGDSWAGRYYVTEAELITFAVNPSLGYRINDRLSVGAGVNLVHSKLTQKAAVNNPEPGVADGELKLEEDDTGYGINLGVLLAPVEGTRVGLTWRSRIDIKYRDLVSLKGLGPVLGTIFSGNQKIDLEMNLPQAVMLSIYHDVDDRLAVVGNLGWQEWSEFGKSDIVVRNAGGSTKLTEDRNFDNTWHIAAGLRYQLTAPWLLMAGFAYDSSPVDNDNRTPDMPLDRQLRYAIGAQHALGKDLTIGASYELMDAGNAKINQNRGPLAGEFKGEYDTNLIHFFNFNVSWRI